MAISKLAGYALIYLCWVLDHTPWYDEGWYLFGHRGCVWGVADRGFRMLERNEEPNRNPGSQ